MGHINHLHPFREGNGRTQREFIRCLALNAGFDLNWSRVNTHETLHASIQSVRDESLLADVIRAVSLNNSNHQTRVVDV